MYLEDMARIGLFIARFTLVLPALLSPPLGNVFAIDPQRQSDEPAAGIQAARLCNFNEATRTYNATDLILCMNELASSVLLQRNVNSNIMADRAYQDARQSYFTYPDYSMPIGGGISNYFDDDMLSSLLSGALPLSGLSNLFNFNSFSRPGFNLFRALSSIAQYDDLKCVPRLLCEVATGSPPGSLSYRQSSGFQDFSQNALYRLLTAFDVGGSSPILTFGKAALLGYTNRGYPNMCYHEYPRCPRQQDQLISYLNNHNGGFFRLFGGSAANYYRPQQSSYRPQQSYYRPYYKQSDNEAEYRIVGSKTKEYPESQSFLKPEADRTGTGKLTFSNSDYYGQTSDAQYIPSYEKDKESSRFVFPSNNRKNHYQSHRFIKSFNAFDDDASIKNDREALRKDRKFFPQDNYHDSTNYAQTYQADFNREPKFEYFSNDDSVVNFPHDSVHKDTSTFTFSNDYREY